MDYSSMDDLADLNFSSSESSEELRLTVLRLTVLRSVDILCMVVYSLVFVLGVVGNGLVVWATAFKLKKTFSTVWFLNLALSDLLYVATLPMAVMHQALDFHWPLGRFMCKMYFTIDSLTMFTSVFLLVIINIHRCVSLAWTSSAWVQRIRQQRGAAWRRKAAYCCAAGAWALAAVLSTPLLVSLDTPASRDLENVSECTVVLFHNTSSWLFSEDYHPFSPSEEELNEQAINVLNISYFLLGFLLPLLVVLCCYASVLWRRMRMRRTSSGPHPPPLGRPFRVTAAITASFFLCFAPYHAMEVFNAEPADEDEDDALFGAFFHAVCFNVAGCLEAVYRCLNPVLYVTVGRRCRCCCHCSCSCSCRDHPEKCSVLEQLRSAFHHHHQPHHHQEEPADLHLSQK